MHYAVYIYINLFYDTTICISHSNLFIAECLFSTLYSSSIFNYFLQFLITTLFPPPSFFILFDATSSSFKLELKMKN